MRTRRFAFTKLSGNVLMRQIFMFDFLASNVEAVKLRDMPRYADRAESFRLTDNSQDPRDISQMVRSSEQRSVPPVNELKDLASDPTKSSPNGTPMITLLLLPCRAASFRSMWWWGAKRRLRNDMDTFSPFLLLLGDDTLQSIALASPEANGLVYVPKGHALLPLPSHKMRVIFVI